jgi:hypothetical protein
MMITTVVVMMMLEMVMAMVTLQVFSTISIIIDKTRQD